MLIIVGIVLRIKMAPVLPVIIRALCRHLVTYGDMMNILKLARNRLARSMEKLLPILAPQSNVHLVSRNSQTISVWDVLKKAAI